MNRTVVVLVVVLVGVVNGAPFNRSDRFDQFLGGLYDKFVGGERPPGGDIYEQMQGDAPVLSEHNRIHGAPNVSDIPVNITRDISEADYFRTMRNRTKDNWIQALKENILRQIGRANMTLSNPGEARLPPPYNFSAIIPAIFNETTIDDDHITEKIRSYYPSCELPTNMDQDIWQNDTVMNLFFNFAYNTDDNKSLNIATATLRLYRIPSENSTKSTQKSSDCETSSEEDKLVRVSIYWYTKSMRKKKVKKRLADSKVMQESSQWVELSIKPATRHWTKGKNMGLAVLVEDQEGNALKADKFFKGASCMVGASTPKPIPTIVIDVARQSNDLERIHSLLGRNSTSHLSSDLPMLPSIDICTLEFPENYSRPPSHISSLRINACNLKKSHDYNRMLAEKDRLERLATLPELPPHLRHSRHENKHHSHNHMDFDPRSNIINKRVLTSEELQALNLNFTINNR